VPVRTDKVSHPRSLTITDSPSDTPVLPRGAMRTFRSSGGTSTRCQRLWDRIGLAGDTGYPVDIAIATPALLRASVGFTPERASPPRHGVPAQRSPRER
jgi:hypothetical protein